MPPDLALLSTLIGSNYSCLQLIFIVPKVFEPFKIDCKCLYFLINKTAMVTVLMHPTSDQANFLALFFKWNLKLFLSCIQQKRQYLLLISTCQQLASSFWCHINVNLEKPSSVANTSFWCTHFIQYFNTQKTAMFFSSCLISFTALEHRRKTTKTRYFSWIKILLYSFVAERQHVIGTMK